MTTSSTPVHAVTEGGIVTEHGSTPISAALVAPTDDAKNRNAIRMRLVPFACWRTDDMRFEFESSFVLPEIATEVQALNDLIERHTTPDGQLPGLSVFGHADPTGNDGFNKALSGRRAQALYAMLVRKVELWEDLHANPLGNDRWDPEAVRSMQATLGQPLQGRPTPAARRQLFRDYMDFVCTKRDDDGKPIRDSQGAPLQLRLRAEDFLAGGNDPKGKGDFQGCGEFNPILLFSEKENRELAKAENKERRDARNGSNRRVLVLLFRPGVRVTPSLWPCPRASEGVAGCEKRFWSDARQRRGARLPDDPRTFERTADTFACRFYQRLIEVSPCEREVKAFRVRLYDPFGRSIPNAPFSFSLGGRAFSPVRSANGSGVITLRDIEAPATCALQWGFPPDRGEAPTLPFSRTIFVIGDDEPNAQAADRKLSNLGYEGDDAATNVSGFQLDFGHLVDPELDITGTFDDRTLQVLDRVYQQSQDDLRDSVVNDEPAA